MGEARSDGYSLRRWMILWTALILFILFFSMLVFVTIRIKIMYKHDEDDDLLEIRLYLAFIKVYTYKAPLIKIDEETAAIVLKEKHKSTTHKKKRQIITVQKMIKNIESFRDMLQKIFDFYGIMRRFLAKVSISDFKWHTEIGVGEAAHSAQLAGFIWGLKGSCIGFLSRYVKIKQLPSLNVQPDFQHLRSRIFLSCMISFRAGHAIIAGFMLLKQWKRKPKAMKVHSMNKHQMT